MKKARKGFTLVELMIVIGIMGILGGMAMIGGQEAVNSAKGTRIVDGLEKGSATMMSYYIDVHKDIDTGTEYDKEKIATGANAYLKSDSELVSTDTAGKYSVTVDGTGAGATWWIGYTFTDAEGDKVKAIIENKATALNLKNGVTSTDAAYDKSKGTVYMKVR